MPDSDMGAEFIHTPVLRREVLEYLTFSIDRPTRMIDGTVGGGGHSATLLKQYPKLELLGIDRDESALTKASESLSFAGDRVTLIQGDYARMAEYAQKQGWEKVDGILLDIGISSPQIDQPERGFSWRTNGPLDMRMDRRSELTASRLLNRASEKELESILREYGEVQKSRRLASAIVSRREQQPFATTQDLVDLCDEVLGHSRPGRAPAPTLVFQAIRIAVNDELGELERVLPVAENLLNKGGRIAVICFHSLEDRIVKNYFRYAAVNCTCPPGLPVCICGKKPTLKVVTHKVVTASEEELAENRRSASAKLRVAEKLN